MIPAYTRLVVDEGHHLEDAQPHTSVNQLSRAECFVFCRDSRDQSLAQQSRIARRAR